MRKVIENIRDGKERAFYDSRDTIFNNISIDGEEDGESAFKECHNIEVNDSNINLRYTFWHDDNLSLNNVHMSVNCRAPLWYSRDINMNNSKLEGVKPFRECDNTKVDNSSLDCIEPFWYCRGIDIRNSNISSAQYAFLNSSDIYLENVKFEGKYSFQYMKRVHVRNCDIDTKDAFWMGEDIIVEDSIIRSQYLGWYSSNLTLINCKIIGTQPFCYCKNLTLKNCTLIDCDLSFERSENISAEIKGENSSIKNPISGYIKAEGIQEVIDEYNSICKIELR